MVKQHSEIEKGNQVLSVLPEPPTSLEGLATLLIDIKSSNSRLKLGSRALLVLSGMIDNPNNAALYSISHLAKTFNVNPSTLTRLAKALGFSGFSEFQNIFRDYTAKSDSFYSKRADDLFKGESGHEGIDLAAKIANDENINIATMLSNLNAATLDAAVEAIHQAKRVRTHGLRQSYPIADYLSYGLGLIRKNVSILSIAEHGIVHGISQLTQGDLLFAIGSKPYTRNTVTAARLARKQGITVVAITDTHSSPLAECANHTFIAPTTGTFFSNNMGSSLVLIEVLLSLLAQKLGDSALESLRHYEQLISEMEIDL
ncbi:MAG: MurR/RpiR family transcriptional regulator [Arenicella sp.]